MDSPSLLTHSADRSVNYLSLEIAPPFAAIFA